MRPCIKAAASEPHANAAPQSQRVRCALPRYTKATPEGREQRCKDQRKAGPEDRPDR